MSGATPTLIPREPIFPLLLAKPPQPHVMPLSKRRVYGRMNLVRDLQREMDDLSDEENELEDLVCIFHLLERVPVLIPIAQTTAVSKRGFTFLIPIGRSLTQQEEKNDVSIRSYLRPSVTHINSDCVEEDSDDSSQASGAAPTIQEDDGENESTQDLDASMEDLDEEGMAGSGDDEEMDDENEEYEEEPSDFV
ncbi:hypothetical protein NLJ89_g6397 [Agrocybe chaxingu]|uniref:Uncharacterized protein n=1 Tax=Agrocybe chaxingu TaxID=84603 RepID=A0A9W8MU39_9AGAR|nr:hypothetical protein NLJ89_g6397 [Agrocybe chaxingu]